MKKVLYLFMCLFVFAGCGKKGNTISEYFPFEQNVKYIYKSNDEIGNQEITTTYVSKETAQQKITAPNNELTCLLEYKDKTLKQVFSNPNFYMYEDVSSYPHNTDITLLKEPLEVGNKWVEEGSTKSEITSVNAVVETPVGKFTAIEITKTFPNGTEKDYYAKGIGLVKTQYFTVTKDYEKNGVQYKGGTRNVESVLSKIEKSNTFNNDINVYIPNINDDNLTKKNKQIKIKTGESFIPLFENVLKDKDINLLDENTKINSIKLDRNNSKVILDLSSNYIAGSGTENLILKSLAYTFCDFYKVNGLELKINGENYKSGHFEYKDGETIDMND